MDVDVNDFQKLIVPGFSVAMSWNKVPMRLSHCASVLFNVIKAQLDVNLGVIKIPENLVSVYYAVEAIADADKTQRSSDYMAKIRKAGICPAVEVLETALGAFNLGYQALGECLIILSSTGGDVLIPEELIPQYQKVLDTQMSFYNPNELVN